MSVKHENQSAPNIKLDVIYNINDKLIVMQFEYDTFLNVQMSASVHPVCMETVQTNIFITSVYANQATRELTVK